MGDLRVLQRSGIGLLENSHTMLAHQGGESPSVRLWWHIQPLETKQLLVLRIKLILDLEMLVANNHRFI